MGLDRQLQILRLRLRSIFRGGRVEQELADELRFHIEERTKEFLDRGLAPTAAREAALRAFGGVEQRKEECRDVRRVNLFEECGNDTRYAFRMMRRSPGVTAVAMLSLALGIGANTAIFTIFDALLLKPLPVDRPDELRTTETVLRLGERLAKSTNTVPYTLFRSLATDDSIFSEVLAFSAVNEPVVTDGARSLQSHGGGLFVSANYFRMLGVRTQTGRLFHPEDGSSLAQTVVLSARYWRQEFGADGQIAGRLITIDGLPRTVIGVTAPEFFGLIVGRIPDYYVPIVEGSPGAARFGVQIVGRLKPGMRDAEVSARLTALTQAHAMMKPDQPPPDVQVLPLDTGLSAVRGQFLKPLSMLMAMVVLLLIVACSNVATILLSRGSARRVEMSIRAAIGAGRGRLFRQLATEGAVIVACGGVLGVVLAKWGTAFLLRLVQLVDGPLAVDLALNVRVLVFTAVTCGLAVLVAAVTPAMHVARVASGAALKDRSPGAKVSGRLGTPFVILQVAMSLVLVAASGFLTRTLYSLVNVDAGFSADRVALVSVVPGARGYEVSRLSSYYQQLTERFRQLPGADAATLAQFSFLTTARTSGTVEVPGFTPASDADRWVQVYQVGGQFFRTMGIPILEGRDFADADLTATPIAVAINATAARRYFGEASAIGRSIYGDARRELRVIAVVADGRYNTLRDSTGALIFVPYSQRLRERMTYAVRFQGVDNEPEAASVQRLLAEVRAFDPLVPARGETLRDLIDKSLGQERFLTVLASFFAATAMLLLALGLYGVIGFSVTERTEEIGVRLALGARPTQVVWSILRRPVAHVMTGIALGAVLTVAGGRLVASVLFNLSPSDPATLMAAAVFTIAVGALAAAVPARRASQVDPLLALRCD